MLCPNNIFLSASFRNTSYDEEKAELVCSYIFRQLSAFADNFRMLCKAEKLACFIIRNNVFYISVDVPLEHRWKLEIDKLAYSKP